MKDYKRILAALTSEPWMILPEWLEAMISIVTQGGDLTALEKRRAEMHPDADKMFVRGNVAHIPITGPIFPKANLFTEMSGATSLEKVALAIGAAEDDPNVEHILFNFDTPGGSVTGVNETAGIIRNSTKHTIGYGFGGVASAGYWLFSSCDTTVADATARLGSIGVVMGVESEKDSGVIEIVSSVSPHKRPDVKTKTGRKVIQEHVDALADVFVETVALNRGVSADTVVNEFGQGGILIGADAVNVGMADKLGSLEELMNEANSNETEGGYTMLKKLKITAKGDEGAQTVAIEEMTAEQLKAANMDLYQAIFDEGFSAAEEQANPIFAAKDKEIAQLKRDKTVLQDSTAQLETRVLKLEKNDAISSEKQMKIEADAIMDARLDASEVPARLHAKVKKMVPYSSYIKDGKFDAEAYKTAVDAEVSDWESSVSAHQVSGLTGQFNRGPEGNKDEQVTGQNKETADRMLGYLK